MHLDRQMKAERRVEEDKEGIERRRKEKKGRGYERAREGKI